MLSLPKIRVSQEMKRRIAWAVAIALFIGMLTFVDFTAPIEEAKRCAPSVLKTQWPRYIGCAISAHENLAAGLIGVAGALFAAWLAFTAVMKQIAAERNILAQQRRDEDERTQRRHASAKEVADVCILPAIRAAAVARAIIDRETIPNQLLSTAIDSAEERVEKAFKHLQAMLNTFGLLESVRDLAAEDRMHYLEIIGTLSNLISVYEHGSSGFKDRLRALLTGFDKLYDLLKKYDLDLAREFAGVSQVVNPPEWTASAMTDDEHADPPTERTTFHKEIAIEQHSRVWLGLERIKTEIKKNWPLITLLIISYFLSTIPAYFLSGWWSVLATVLSILFSTVVGYYAITRLITIEKIESS